MNEITTILSLTSTILLSALIILLYKFKRSIPDIQQVLDDVGESIGEQLTQIFEKPVVSKAMSQLGKKSGEVRANNALRNKAANAVLDQIPSARFILEQLGLTPMEGLQLYNDPIVGPMIRGMLSRGSQGFMGKSQGRSNISSEDVFKVT